MSTLGKDPHRNYSGGQLTGRHVRTTRYRVSASGFNRMPRTKINVRRKLPAQLAAAVVVHSETRKGRPVTNEIYSYSRVSIAHGVAPAEQSKVTEYQSCTAHTAQQKMHLFLVSSSGK
jgi:hypothetical protein